MVTTFVFLLFGSLAIAGLIDMVKIHINQSRETREIERLRLARIEAFRGKCYRPDGD